MEKRTGAKDKQPGKRLLIKIVKEHLLSNLI